MSSFLQPPSRKNENEARDFVQIFLAINHFFTSSIHPFIYEILNYIIIIIWHAVTTTMRTNERTNEVKKRKAKDGGGDI